MRRVPPLLALWLLPAALFAQSSHSPGPAPQPLPGARLAPVPLLLAKHVPDVPEGQGLVVEAVAAQSPADRLGLRPYDVLLRYAGQPVHNLSQLKDLLREVPPDGRGTWVVLRGGRVVTVPEHAAADGPTDAPPARLKPAGPPAVHLEAEPLAGDRLRVTFTYYADGGGKLTQQTCTGSLEDIERQIRQLTRARLIPARVQELVEVALTRLRVLQPAARTDG